MKKGIIVFLTLVAVGAGGFYLYKPNLVKQYLGLPYFDEQGAYIGRDIKPEEWTNPDKIQAKIGPKILSKLGNLDETSVSTFLSDPANRLMLNQWMIAQRFIESQEAEDKGAEARKNELEAATKEMERVEKNLSALPAGCEPSARAAYEHNRAKERLASAKSESKAVRKVSTLIKKPEGKELVDKVLNNEQWSKQFAFTGECARPGTALGILSAISKKNPDYASAPILRDTATATAIEFARSDWEVSKAVKRNNYFATSWKEGSLNSIYDTLPFWQRRMVCGAKAKFDSDFGSVESLKWCNENVKIPADQYTGSCWRCAYKLFNPFGESIHGSFYVSPYDDTYGRNRARFTYEIGGVCGFLSHFGAFSAIANGIPASTAGEPGHCAFVVLVNEKWTPGYSLSWERGMHWTMWNNNHRFTSLHMASDLNSPENEKATAQSDALRVAAGELKRQGKAEKALGAYKSAVSTQPLNYQAWREYADCIREKAPTNAQAWCDLNKLMCEKFVPRYAENADFLLDSYVYADMAKAMEANPEGLRQEFMRFWSSVGEMGADRWHIEDMANRQMQLLKIDGKNPDAVIKAVGDIISRVSSAPKYIPVVLGWSNKFADSMKPEDKVRLMQASFKGIAKMSGAEDSDKTKILASLVIGAEKARDMSTFQSIRGMLPEGYGKSNIPKFEPFPGKLMSQGGLLWTSSTCGHDAPCEHAGVLEPTGGRFHTDNQENPYVVVQLTKQTHLSGVVIVGTDHNKQRLYDIHVEISETANDNDWHEVGTFPNLNGRVHRLDLQGKSPLAKYVRIRRGGAKQFFHLNGIYVYGKPAA